jgi:hypothetical protein
MKVTTRSKHMTGEGDALDIGKDKEILDGS